MEYHVILSGGCNSDTMQLTLKAEGTATAENMVQFFDCEGNVVASWNINQLVGFYKEGVVKFEQ